MDATPVIAIFDVGKTNKKLFLFDEHYEIVYQTSVQFAEITDEDGDNCEDIKALRRWIFNSLNEVLALKQYNIKAINFSAYGASLVYLDNEGHELTQVYSYLKPYPGRLKQNLHITHGDEKILAMQTASPALGSLNSGWQLYRLKYGQPGVYAQVSSALHLPQYLSYLLTGKAFSDMTSIGCHTALWDFDNNDYHHWVKAEGLTGKLAPVMPGNKTFSAEINGRHIQVGIGLHDSSAALIPYLISFKEPFLLLSTGTWNISLNPFDQTPLTADELEHDVLKYIQYQGIPVKASRLFAGYEFEQQVKRIAAHFGRDEARYKHMEFDADVSARLKGADTQAQFSDRDLGAFATDVEAYHQLMIDLVVHQKRSTAMVMNGTPVKQIFVDGGFSKNPVFMQLLAAAFPAIEVFAASVAQATATGAALAIHQAWNSKPWPTDMIALKHYPAKVDVKNTV
ncbi:carbohydrate kinase [Mucilaginibacter sp. UR6-1]|nr:carbohydrate kinase [Mucilaginibacter sp. UR6-1]